MKELRQHKHFLVLRLIAHKNEYSLLAKIFQRSIEEVWDA